MLLVSAKKFGVSYITERKFPKKALALKRFLKRLSQLDVMKKLKTPDKTQRILSGVFVCFGSTT